MVLPPGAGSSRSGTAVFIYWAFDTAAGIAVVSFIEFVSPLVTETIFASSWRRAPPDASPLERRLKIIAADATSTIWGWALGISSMGNYGGLEARQFKLHRRRLATNTIFQQTPVHGSNSTTLLQSYGSTHRDLSTTRRMERLGVMEFDREICRARPKPVTGISAGVRRGDPSAARCPVSRRLSPDTRGRGRTPCERRSVATERGRRGTLRTVSDRQFSALRHNVLAPARSLSLMVACDLALLRFALSAEAMSKRGQYGWGRPNTSRTGPVGRGRAPPPVNARQ